MFKSRRKSQEDLKVTERDFVKIYYEFDSEKSKPYKLFEREGFFDSWLLVGNYKTLNEAQEVGRSRARKVVDMGIFEQGRRKGMLSWWEEAKPNLRALEVIHNTPPPPLHVSRDKNAVDEVEVDQRVRRVSKSGSSSRSLSRSGSRSSSKPSSKRSSQILREANDALINEENIMENNQRERLETAVQLLAMEEENRTIAINEPVTAEVATLLVEEPKSRLKRAQSATSVPRWPAFMVVDDGPLVKPEMLRSKSDDAHWPELRVVETKEPVDYKPLIQLKK